jgi:dTDP-4-amino-4,6-dideoxygalactose transaminase
MPERIALEGGTPVRGKENPLPGVFPREIAPNVRRYVEEVLASGFTSNHTTRFEKAFAEACGTKHAVGIDNCTSAVHTAVAAAGVEPGDHVVVSAISDYGSVAGVLWQNALPVFADVDIRTGNVTAETIAAAITPRTRAIIAVHFYGLMCDMDPIVALARERGLTLIEDACQTPLAEYKGKKAGAMGTAGCFSFDAEKHFSTDHGGAMITDDDALAEAARKFALGRGAVPVPGYGRVHDTIGANYRYGSVLSAIALGQLETLPEQNRRRTALAARLTERLAGVPGVETPYVVPGSTPIWWLYFIRFRLEEFDADLDTLAGALTAEGLPGGTGRYYLLPESLTYLRDRGHMYGNSPFPFDYFPDQDVPTYGSDACPVAHKHLSQLYRWPWTDRFTERDVDDMAAMIARVAARYHRCR